MSNSVEPLKEWLSDFNQTIYQDMVKHLNLVMTRPFTASGITLLVASGIRFLASVTTLTGYEKKMLLLSAIRETVQHANISDDEKTTFLSLVDTFGDSLIENLVQFGKEHIIDNVNTCTCFGSKSSKSSKGSKTSKRARSAKTMAKNSREIPQHLSNVTEYLKIKLQKPITAPKIITLIADGILFIDQYRSLSGAEKKNIVINALHAVITESNLVAEEDKTMLISVVDMFADSTIDYLVDFGKYAYLKLRQGCCKK